MTSLSRRLLSVWVLQVMATTAAWADDSPPAPASSAPAPRSAECNAGGAPCLRVLDEAHIDDVERAYRIPLDRLAAYARKAEAIIPADKSDGDYRAQAWLATLGLPAEQVLVFRDCTLFLLGDDGELTEVFIGGKPQPRAFNPFEEGSCDAVAVTQFLGDSQELLIRRSYGDGGDSVSWFDLFTFERTAETRAPNMNVIFHGTLMEETASDDSDDDAASDALLRSTTFEPLDPSSKPLVFRAHRLTTMGKLNLTDERRFVWNGTKFEEQTEPKNRKIAADNEKRIATEHEKLAAARRREAAANARALDQKRATAMSALPALLAQCRSALKTIRDIDNSIGNARAARDLVKVDALARKKQSTLGTYRGVVDKVQKNLTFLRTSGATAEALSSAQQMIYEECNQRLAP